MKQAVIWALEAGFRHIDCAAIYGNEVEIGEALHEAFGPGKVKRLHHIAVKAQSISNNIQHVVCSPGPEKRGRVHHIQAVEYPTSPRGCGASSPEDPEGPEAGVPGPLPHPLALRLPVSSTSTKVS